jgi:hypothetical protein
MVSGSSPLGSFRARRDWCREARMLVFGLEGRKLVRIGASLAQGTIFPAPIFAIKSASQNCNLSRNVLLRHGSDVANDSRRESPH